MKKICLLFGIIFTFAFLGCKTVDLEKTSTPAAEGDETLHSLEAEEERNEEELHEYLIQEELKVQDIEPTVVYIEKPVYVPYDNGKSDIKKIQGIDAAKESIEKSTIKPENYKDGTFYYTYNENFVYEVYAQPYHLTDIILEDGEIVMGNPLLSEDASVWELTANVARNPSLKETIDQQCLTKIYLADESAQNPALAASYREFGLTDSEIIALSNAQMKHDYYFKNPLGCRMFSLDLDAFQLALISSDHELLDHIEEKYGRNTTQELAFEILEATREKYAGIGKNPHLLDYEKYQEMIGA